MKPKIIRVPRSLHPRPTPRRRPVRWPWVRLMVMALAGLTLIVVTADVTHWRIRADKALDAAGESSLVSEALIDVTTATNRYVDLAGRFTAAWPASWAAYPYKNEGDYAVTLRGPHRMELSIMVLDIGDGGQAAVQAALRSFELQQRIHVPTEPVEFHGRPAYRRRLPLGTITVEAVDFAAGRQHVHIAVSAPRASFEDLRPVLEEMLQRVEVPADP